MTSLDIHVVGKLRQAAVGDQCLELLIGVDPDTYRGCCQRQLAIRDVTQPGFSEGTEINLLGLALLWPA